MPLPTPSAGESRDDFIARCMVNETMLADFPEQDQRVAVCSQQWRDREKSVQTVNRAYSVLEVKAIEDEKRIIRGVATTPEPDRIGDVVEPLGVKFKNPLPLLHHHRADQPVGTVKLDKPTKSGITFEARLPQIQEAGPLKDRVDTAWAEIKAGLIRGVSVGFRAIEHAFLEGGNGIRFIASEILELSLVTVPANAAATITEIRSIDSELLAASGHEQADDRREPSPASRDKPKPVKLRPKEGTKMKTIAEQISAFEAARQTKAARMEELMNAAAEKGETLDAEQSEEYDNLETEVKSVDSHLTRLRELEKSKATTAKAVEKIDNAEKGSQARAGVVVKGEQNLPPGLTYTRIVRAKAIGRLDNESPREVAKALYGENSSVYGIMQKAAVAAGTTSDATWAGALISDESGAAADFVAFLRPMTILGRFGANGVPSLRQVPFRRALLGQTSGGSAYWTGEGKPKPLTKFDFSRTTLEPLKVANIAVITEEVLRDSSPSAEILVRDGLAAALAERLDIDFLDPDKSASAGVSPASVSNGITALTSDGNDADSVREDIKALVATFTAANNRPSSGVWIMSSAIALALSLMQNPLGQAEFPGMGMTGGTFFGMPAIVSDYVRDFADSLGEYVFLVNANDVYLADEGGIRIDMSREASLQMNDAPTTQDATTGTGTSLVSLWQTNAVGFLAERTINWARRRTEAVAVLGSVNWGTPVSGA